MRERPAEVFTQTGPDIACKSARLLQPLLEIVRAVRQPEGLKWSGMALRIFAQQHEVAVIRHQYKPVTVPVTAYLRRSSAVSHASSPEWLDLHNTPLRRRGVGWMSAPVPGGERMDSRFHGNDGLGALCPHESDEPERRPRWACLAV